MAHSAEQAPGSCCGSHEGRRPSIETVRDHAVHGHSHDGHIDAETAIDPVCEMMVEIASAMA